MKRIISLISMVLAVVLMMTGCSSGGDTASASSVKIVVAAPYVLEEALPEFDAALRAALPELNTEESSMLIQSVSTGDTESDPMSAMAGMTKIMTMMMSKEIEIMICDADNARRHGESGEAYVPLSELFTEEEQAELGIAPLTVAVVDDEGNVTGEESAPCGISLAHCEGVKNIFKMSDLGLYVLATSEEIANLENIKTTIRCILAMQ